MLRLGIFVFGYLCVGAVLVSAGELRGSELASAALNQCDSVADRPTEKERAVLEQALLTAERALAEVPNEPKAHFAVFCALAKRTYLDGFSLRSMWALRRLHNEIDATLALAPNYGDALIAKGGFLLNLPRVVGGDAHEAENLLRRAVTLEPSRISARLHHAEALRQLGLRDAAAQEARIAKHLAEHEGRHEQAQEAQALLRGLTD